MTNNINLNSSQLCAIQLSTYMCTAADVSSALSANFNVVSSELSTLSSNIYSSLSHLPQLDDSSTLENLMTTTNGIVSTFSRQSATNGNSTEFQSITTLDQVNAYLNSLQTQITQLQNSISQSGGETTVQQYDDTNVINRISSCELSCENLSAAIENLDTSTTVTEEYDDSELRSKLTTLELSCSTLSIAIQNIDNSSTSESNLEDLAQSAVNNTLSNYFQIVASADFDPTTATNGVIYFIV